MIVFIQSHFFRRVSNKITSFIYDNLKIKLYKFSIVIDYFVIGPRFCPAIVPAIPSYSTTAARG